MNLRTILFFLVVVTATLSGCATAPIERDPFVGFSKAAAEEKRTPQSGLLTDIRLGVVLSPSVRDSIATLENTRQQSVKLMNPWALSDLDDQQIYQRPIGILLHRFKEVTVVRTMEEALNKDIDMIMILEMQFKLLPPGEQVTAVRVSGKFMDKNNSLIELVEGEGRETFPIPWTKLNFTGAWSLAMNDFLEDIDRHSKKIASGAGYVTVSTNPRFLPKIPSYSLNVAR